MRLGQTATPLPRIQDSYGFGLIKKPAVFKLRDHGRVLTPRRALDAFSDCAPAVASEVGALSDTLFQFRLPGVNKGGKV